MKKLLISILALAGCIGIYFWCGNTQFEVAEGTAQTEASEEAEGKADEAEAGEMAQNEEAVPEKHLLNPESDDTSSGDHIDTKYYKINDYYNWESDETLTMISHFETYEQQESYTCGPSSAYMVLNYFDKELAKEYDEWKIAELCGSTGGGVGTSAEQIANFFTEELGWDAEYYMSHDKKFASQEDFAIFLKNNALDWGYPMIVDWSISSGHWTTIIGYDTMGTDTLDDDVLIFGDSGDGGDHYQDGYMTFSFVRFFRMWKESTPFDGEEVYRQQYIIAHPKDV